jgi:transposase-like protein
MTLPDIIRLFPTDTACRELLERLRWPDSVKCLRCSGKVNPLGDKLYHCSACRYQFAVTTGTIFADTHLALEKWFLAVLLLCEAKKGMSAKQLQRTLGTGYKTAWYLFHRVRAAMATAVRPALTGIVEMDETYVGGKEKSDKPGTYVGTRSQQSISRGIWPRWSSDSTAVGARTFSSTLCTTWPQPTLSRLPIWSSE